MILRTPRGRSGITLTEILISILILGIGFWFGMIKRSFKVKPSV